MPVSRLNEGDYIPNGQGGFSEASGTEAVLERALFLLTARRGMFPLCPDLGSRLYQLTREKTTLRGTLGAAYAAEALEPIKGLSVESAVWEEESGTLTVYLNWEGESMAVSVSV